MEEDEEDGDLLLQTAHDAFSRTGQEEHLLLKADGFDPRTASLSLMERLLTTDPNTQAVDDMKRLEPVMECTGFSVDEAARTLLIWEEISGLREQGLSTVDIVQHLTRRLKSTSVSSARLRGHLTEAGRNATDKLASCSRKQKFSGWTEDDNPQLPPTTPKRSRFQ